MTHCDLTNPNARKAVATVWRHLRKHFPGDARFLGEIVKRIIPLTEVEAADGTIGWWLLDHFQTDEEEMARYERYGKDHGQGSGILKLLDVDEMTVGTIAHELGHAFSSSEDKTERGGPLDEWASEAAADMHAVRWGLLTREDIRRRHAENVSPVQGQGVMQGAAWAHHGPPPGGAWVESSGRRWRLRDDFVFEIVDG